MKVKRPQGFTLIEIIVTVTIMAIIMSVAANGFSRQNSKSNLSAAAEGLASDIRSAAMSALNFEQFQLQSPGGWGVYFDLGTNTYTIYADLNSDRIYDLNEKFKSITLSHNITISSICFSSCGTVNGAVDFTLPGATPYYQTAQITDVTGDLEITLLDNVTSETKNIFVNSFAAVSTQ